MVRCRLASYDNSPLAASFSSAGHRTLSHPSLFFDAEFRTSLIGVETIALGDLIFPLPPSSNEPARRCSVQPPRRRRQRPGDRSAGPFLPPSTATPISNARSRDSCARWRSDMHALLPSTMAPPLVPILVLKDFSSLQAFLPFFLSLFLLIFVHVLPNFLFIHYFQVTYCVLYVAFCWSPYVERAH